MNKPNTWLLLESLKSCLQEISIANGFHTDAGCYVTLEPGQIPDDQEALIGVVLDTVLRPDDPAFRGLGNLVTAVVIAKVPANKSESQQKLNCLIEDIQKALSDKQKQFRAGTHQPRFVEARIIPPADGMSWIGAEVRYSANVRLR